MLEITESEFAKEVEQSDKIVIVDFYAPWCGPCRSLGPILDNIQAKNQDRVKVVKINTDQDTNLAIRFQVGALPTVVFLRNGKLETTLVGLQTESKYQEIVDKIASG